MLATQMLTGLENKSAFDSMLHEGMRSVHVINRVRSILSKHQCKDMDSRAFFFKALLNRQKRKNNKSN